MLEKLHGFDYCSIYRYTFIKYAWKMPPIIMVLLIDFGKILDIRLYRLKTYFFQAISSNTLNGIYLYGNAH